MRNCSIIAVRPTSSRGAGMMPSASNAMLPRTHGSQRPWRPTPSYYTALCGLALTTPNAAIGQSDAVVDQLQAAHRLVPLVGDIAIDAATALADHHRYEEAAAAILPIAANPHGGNTERAQALLDRIQSETAALLDSRPTRADGELTNRELLADAIRRHASAIEAPCASTISTSRSLPMISSGLCFLLGIQCPFHGPDYHSFWATQRGADQFSERIGKLILNSTLLWRAVVAGVCVAMSQDIAP